MRSALVAAAVAGGSEPGVSVKWIILLCAIGIAAIIGAVYYFRNKIFPGSSGGQAPNAGEDEGENNEQEPNSGDNAGADHDSAERRRLVLEYCDILQAIENFKLQEAYTRIFNRCFSIYQLLAGLNRRSRKENLSDAIFLDEIKTELDYRSFHKVLNANGYIVNVNIEQIDREYYLEKTAGKPVEPIRIEVEKRKAELEAKRRAHSSMEYMDLTGKDLYQLMQAVNAGDAARCRALSEKIEATLKAHGCFPLFSDDPIVLASVEFPLNYTDEPAAVTELPALYFINREGKYSLIGNCTGTRRVIV